MDQKWGESIVSCHGSVNKCTEGKVNPENLFASHEPTTIYEIVQWIKRVKYDQGKEIIATKFFTFYST